MAALPTAEKEQSGAFIVNFFPRLYRNISDTEPVSTQRDERVLVLWSNDLESIIPQCTDFEERLIKLVWRARRHISAATPEPLSSDTPSDADLTEKSKEASGDLITIAEQTPPPRSFWKMFSWRSTRSDQDLEAAAKKKRKMKLLAPMYSGFGIGLSLCKCAVCPLGVRLTRLLSSLSR